MRGVLLACVLFALASLSGCVSFVEDGNDPDVDALAAEADKALDEYQAKAGHIAGTVTDASTGKGLSGATVDLVGVKSTVTSGSAGDFAFVDIVPAIYTLRTTAPGYLDTEQSVEVVAGDFARPAVALQPAPPPAYFTVNELDTYSGYTLGILYTSCECSMEVPVDATGLQGAILEAELNGSMLMDADGFEYQVTGENGSSIAAGWSGVPMHVELDPASLPAGETITVEVRPSSGPFMPITQQAFIVYLTLFYNAPAPEGYSAFE